jgi:mRNA-degrading endonuclease RelE of RelBE toxin-antitoxin system
MTTQSVEIPDHVLTALKRLTPEQRQQVFDLIEDLSQERNSAEQPPELPKKQRVFGQYAGKIWMSDDFDDPLPDSFWLGES